MADRAAIASRREERLERRQAQILDAARACVRAEGFHAASMSRIAAEASMSVGHIYQIFENKEAIMIALCERDFEDFMLHMNRIEESDNSDVTTLIETFINKTVWFLDHDRSALALEVMAEAGRNPKVLELVLRVDHEVRGAIRRIIEPLLETLTQEEADARIEMLLMMTRALGVHAGTHPVCDPQRLFAGLKLALQGVLSVPQRAEAARKAD